MTATTDDLVALARYAVGRPWWQWLPGMRVRIETPWGTTPWERIAEVNWPEYFYREYLPDLSDPATKACLLSIIRTELKDPNISSIFLKGASSEWVIGNVNSANVHDVTYHGYGNTEINALIYTLDKYFSWKQNE